MKNLRRHAFNDDTVLALAKRERQALVRTLIAEGKRSQESMFLLPSAVVKATTVRHRVLSFD